MGGKRLGRESFNVILRDVKRKEGRRKSIKYQQFRINVDALKIFPNYSSYTNTHTHTPTQIIIVSFAIIFFSLGLKNAPANFMAFLGRIIKTLKT